MAADESSESGNTVFYEDPSTQFHGCGGAAAADEERSYMNVGISDDSMSQATENKKLSKKVVSLTVEQGSESCGDTVFYEDPTAQAQEMSRAATSSTHPILPPTAHPVPVVPAMPKETRETPSTPMTIDQVTAPGRVATPILPFTGSNPLKRSRSEDIERERPA